MSRFCRIAVAAEVREFCSRVTITQRYRNGESQPIEAVYVFPLDEVAVCGFAAIVDGVRELLLTTQS